VVLAGTLAVRSGSADERWILEPGPEAPNAQKLGAADVERAQKLAKEKKYAEAAQVLEALDRKLPAAVHDCNLALAYLRAGAASTTFNCGYGHGASVLEVIETVRRVSGADFNVEHAARRTGDPAQIVAASDRIRSVLGWRPKFDDLSVIVGHALAWEHKLLARAG